MLSSCWIISTVKVGDTETFMNNSLTDILGMKLDELAKSSLVLSFNETPRTELIEDRFYMEMPNSGIAFIATLDGRVMTIQLHAEGYEGYKTFLELLPDEISFSDDRRRIHARLGQPSVSGGGTVIQFFGKAPRWDRYDRDSYALHIQYTDLEESINLISLMRPDAIPR